jgi:hypothetical protein
MVICHEEVRHTEKRQAYEVTDYCSSRTDFRHKMSSPPEILASCVRVPLWVWMSIGVYSLCCPA